MSRFTWLSRWLARRGLRIAGRNALASMLLEVQQDCLTQRKRASAMRALADVFRDRVDELQQRAWRSDQYRSWWLEEKATRELAEARVQELEAAVRWALGEEGDFPHRLEGDPAYYWRPELRRRAGVDRG